MQGLMMERPLLISDLLEHAAAVHGDREIVSVTDYDQVAVAWQFRWALGFSRNQAPIGTLGELVIKFPIRGSYQLPKYGKPDQCNRAVGGALAAELRRRGYRDERLGRAVRGRPQAHLGRKRLVVPAVFAIVDGEAHVGG